MTGRYYTALSISKGGAPTNLASFRSRFCEGLEIFSGIFDFSHTSMGKDLLKPCLSTGNNKADLY
jgi:hypothetical protein